MTWWLWTVAAVIGVALFGMGLLIGRVWFGIDDENVSDRTDRRVNAVFSVGFGVIGLAILANVIVLTARYHDQVECNSDMVNHLRANADARRAVIIADTEVDLAVIQYLDTERHHQGVIPTTAPAVQNLIDKVDVAHLARMHQLQVYEANLYTICGEEDS